MTPNTRTLKGQSYCSQRWANPAWPKGSKSRGFSNHITPDYSISMLDEWRKSATDICYLAEVTPEKADYINGLLRMRVVDEIILYTLPFIAGTGKRFFQSALPQEQWTLTSQKVYRNGVVRHIYKACV